MLVSIKLVDLDVEAILEDSAVDTAAGTGSSEGVTEIERKEDTHRVDSVVEQGLGSRVDMGDERGMVSLCSSKQNRSDVSHDYLSAMLFVVGWIFIR
ncbi:hypothetical protein BT69DRAFT_1336432 [Atractiella rhizophila]|nr:hypothetical protein BT69DRAFT_1336432 [Atractiella rhizophila]